MKKLLLVLLGLQSFVFAQTIPNGAFEKWSTITYDNPDFWYTANSDRGVETGIYTVSKVTGSSGFALRMETKSYNSDLMESWISTTDNDPRMGEGGYPYSQKPSVFTGKFRCNIVAGDTGFIIAIFKKNGVIMGSSTATFIGTTSSFSSFSFPVLIAYIPDSVVIAASSSNLINEIGVQVGSWLEVDELAFGGTGITQPILNGNFENWTNFNMSLVQDWNMFGKEGISRIADPFKGTYAIKIRTINDPQDGIRQCGLRLSKEDNNGQTMERGVPYTLLQDTLFGYYKLSTPGVDNSYIFVRTFKNGNQVGWFGKDLMPSVGYQYFEIIINNTTQPDSLDVVIESSAQNTKLEGTTLIIDEIQLKSSKLNTGVLEVRNPFRKATFYVYPNPAMDVLNIKTEVSENLTIKVYNMSGVEVKSQIINPQTSKTVDIEQLNSGLYVISIGKENGSSFYSRFIKN